MLWASNLFLPWFSCKAFSPAPRSSAQRKKHSSQALQVLWIQLHKHIKHATLKGQDLPVAYTETTNKKRIITFIVLKQLLSIRMFTRSKKRVDFFSLNWQTSSVIKKIIFTAQTTQEFSTRDTKRTFKAVQSLRFSYPAVLEHKNNKHRKFQQLHETH